MVLALAFISGAIMADVATGSREYKIMLKAERFVGDEAQAIKTSTDFWRACGKAFGSDVLLMRGALDQPKDRRLVRFLDTADQRLVAHSYIFRERTDIEGQKREYTLKFRHPDRYLAASRDMKAANGKARMKFEEDIKPAFQSLYSYSTTLEVPPDKSVAKVKGLMKLYPGLGDSLTGFNLDEPLVTVANMTARELVIGGGSMQIGKRLNVWSSCVMVLWYNQAEPNGNPVVAEFSFKYGGDGQRFGPGAVGRAFNVFQSLQTKMTDWIDPNSKTKTAFAYA